MGERNVKWVWPLVAFVAVGGACCGCLWPFPTPPRFSHSFDLGGGRTMTVWSTRRETHILSGHFMDVSAQIIYYRVDAGPRGVVPTWFLDHDDGGEHVFQAVRSADGRLACVYEVGRAVKYSEYLLIYDAESGESWPRLRDDESLSLPSVTDKWRARFQRLKVEFPEVPAPDPFGDRQERFKAAPAP